MLKNVFFALACKNIVFLLFIQSSFRWKQIHSGSFQLRFLYKLSLFFYTHNCLNSLYSAPNGLEFYPKCGESLQTIDRTGTQNINDTLDEIYRDPLKDLNFVRTTDFWTGSVDPAVYNPENIILKYLSDPLNGKTYLYIDRKYRGISNYIKNLSWICSWDDTYSDNELTYYLLSTSISTLLNSSP